MDKTFPAALKASALARRWSDTGLTPQHLPLFPKGLSRLQRPALPALCPPTPWGMEGGGQGLPKCYFTTTKLTESQQPVLLRRLGSPVCFWPQSLPANQRALACFSTSPAHPRSTHVPQALATFKGPCTPQFISDLPSLTQYFLT